MPKPATSCVRALFSQFFLIHSGLFGAYGGLDGLLVFLRHCLWHTVYALCNLGLLIFLYHSAVSIYFSTLRERLRTGSSDAITVLDLRKTRAMRRISNVNVGDSLNHAAT